MEQNKFTFTGHAGEVRWGYQVAALVGTWTLTVQPTGTDLSAEVTSADTYRIEQPSLTFRVTRQNGRRWEWPIESLLVAGGTLKARLGPQKE